MIELTRLYTMPNCKVCERIAAEHPEAAVRELRVLARGDMPAGLSRSEWDDLVEDRAACEFYGVSLNTVVCMWSDGSVTNG